MKPEYWETAKKHISDKDEILGNIIAEYKGEGLKKRNGAFLTLARSITGQQISVKAADAVWNRMEAGVKEVTAKNMLAVSEEDLRSFGYSRQKISYLKNIAENFDLGNISEELLNELEEEAAIKELIKLRGVGRWTAEMFLIFNSLKPDIFPIDDIGLQKAVKLHYKHENPSDLEAISAIGERWKPYRTVATWYLWRSLDPHPVEY